MILSVRTYRPSSQLVILLLSWIWVIWKSIATSVVADSTTIYEPLSRFYFSINPQGSALNVVIGIFILLAQALYLSYILQKHNIIEQNNWLPAILFMILSGMGSNHILSPTILANLFILLAVDRMFESYESIKGIDNIMLAGFYSTIAMLFYSPYVLFIAAIIIGLIILRNLNWRYFIITIIGVFIPIIYLGTFLFVNDSLSKEMIDMQMMLNSIAPSLLKLNLEGIIRFSIITFLMIISLFHLFINMQGKLIKTRKKTGIIITYSIISVVVAIISLQSFIESLMSISLFAATTLALQISTSKSNLFSTIIFWIIIGITLLSNLGIF